MNINPGSLISFIKDFGIIIVAALVAYIFLAYRTETADFLKNQAEYQRMQSREMEQLKTTLKQLTDASRALEAKIGKKKEVVQKIKLDLGKSIRTLNRSVKELKKNVKTPEESYQRLVAAWDYKSVTR